MTDSEPWVRLEGAGDEPAIHAVNRAAFPSDLEGRLVDALRRAGRLLLSLVAVHDGQVVGHVAFSPVTVGGLPAGWGLAPLAVLPQFQRQGIGGALVGAGLDESRARGVRSVVLLGDPAYYDRFGFQPARHWNLRDEYGGGDAFQAIEFATGAFPTGGGLVQYAPEFSLFADDGTSEKP